MIEVPCNTPCRTPKAGPKSTLRVVGCRGKTLLFDALTVTYSLPWPPSPRQRIHDNMPSLPAGVTANTHSPRQQAHKTRGARHATRTRRR